MSNTDFGNPDVIVIGAGNAAACAAISARQAGASVIMLEAAPQAECGGNTRFTGGGFRFPFKGIADLEPLMPELTDAEKAKLDFGVYTEENYYDDMGRQTNYRTDPEMCEILVTQSYDAMLWLRKNGVKFEPTYQHTVKVDGIFKFWGGLACVMWGGGPGLVELEHKACAREGIKIFCDTPAIGLLQDAKGHVCGVSAQSNGDNVDIRAKAVILACGGFEASGEMRARYLGPGWDLAKVRGSRYNQGAGIRMALDAGAMPYGHYSGCHSVPWELNAPLFGDLRVGDQFQKHSYPFCIMVNANGERFADEGADLRIFTYAKFGGAILRQPDHFAWQVYDAKTIPMLRPEYKIKQVTKVTANSLEELSKKMSGVDAQGFMREVTAYNNSVQTTAKFDPLIRDGRCTTGLKVPKSNWAQTIDQPPFEAYATTCGITFTFGGIKITRDAEVESVSGRPIPGLFATGELVGGLFYHNYPAGAGLMGGSVFGRIAGRSAASHVKK